MTEELEELQSPQREISRWGVGGSKQQNVTHWSPGRGSATVSEEKLSVAGV